MIVLSSATAIREIVDKAGWSASGRPPLYLADLYAGDKYLLWMSDGEGFILSAYLKDTHFFSSTAPELRATRNIVAVFFAKQNVFKWRSVVSAESTQLLFEIMENPDVCPSLHRVFVTVYLIAS